MFISAGSTLHFKCPPQGGGRGRKIEFSNTFEPDNSYLFPELTVVVKAKFYQECCG